MWGKPKQSVMTKIPKLYETESVPLKDKLIYLHFFIAGCDWYIAEYDGANLFWGYAILNNDDQTAEWGYISFEDLKEIKTVKYGYEIECDRYWKIRKASEVKDIKL